MNTNDDPTAEPDDPTERIIVRLDRLISATEDGTSAVTKERRWRRLSIGLLASIVVLLSVAGLDHMQGERRDRLRTEQAVCVERQARSVENRKVQARVAVYEAQFYGRPPAEVRRLSEGVRAIVAGSLPLPKC